ncbi:MAG TPA: sensor histidine kinase [Flavobacteriia bacterium]|nr:sensor histidine kinase [Flavobacteriia bacterium]
MKYKKTYKFAFYSSFLLTLVTLILVTLIHRLTLGINVNTSFLIALGISLFFISFFIIQFRVEKFIYKRIQKIYREVSILNETKLDKNTITTNMENLSKNVKQFAENKKTEIAILQERENYRREFLGNISHELKTPLFTVQGYILTLLEGAINDKNIRLKYLERANNGVERLNHIVKDLDMISKLETGDLHLESKNFNILSLIDEVFDLLEMTAKKRNIILSYDRVYEGKIMVKADRNRIEQVLINLITNAIHYGNENDFVKVAINTFSDNTIKICIIDNGEGLTKEAVSRVFERFYRTDKSRSRNLGGTGLGLSIVKHIVEAHNQKIFAESEVGKGSTFSFTLELV